MRHPLLKPLFTLCVPAAALLLAAPAAADLRTHPMMAGSSTVFTFAAAVAERQAARGAGRPALVLPMGSGAGIAWFCEGLGPATPDIVMASRAMTAEEAGACAQAGVTPLTRHHIGDDGIVLAMHPAGAIEALALDELWLAVAARVPDPHQAGRWIANPYRFWSDLRADLPATPILVLGPPATSGTRDALVSLALGPACLRAVAAQPAAAGEAARCGEIRRDGAWMDAGENDDALVARLQEDPAALGVLGYGAVARNPGRVRALCVAGFCPDPGSIRAGEYPLSRPLYLYMKPAHRNFVPDLDALVAAFFAPDAVAAGGYLLPLGLVPAGHAPDESPLAAAAPPAPRADWALRATGAVIVAVLLCFGLGMALVRRPMPANRRLEGTVRMTLLSSALVSPLLLALVLVALVVPALNFFLAVSPLAFLGGTHWSPESAIRVGQVIGEGAFGVLPVLLGSVLIALIALLLAVPLALAAALHGYAWAGPRFRAGWRFGIRLAALVPAVVFGLFAALTVAPAVTAVAGALGLHAAAGNALAAGLVVGIMLLPVLSLRIGEALAAVPLASAQSALGLGASRWEALRDIVLPAAADGIGAAVLLAVTRALGETVIVLMAVGFIASLSFNPLATGTSLTAQIVALMAGTHELDNVRTQLPFVLGLFLAILVLPLNAWALRMLRRTHVNPLPSF
jgi:phosphate transport system permease protein